MKILSVIRQMSAGLAHKQEATAVYLFLVGVPLNLTDGVIRPDPRTNVLQGRWSLS